MIWYKQGVCGDLTILAQKGLGIIAELYKKQYEDLYITSIRDGNHKYGSLHYNGNAFDFLKPLKELSLALILDTLGDANWDVVDEGDHIHAEYDPK